MLIEERRVDEETQSLLTGVISQHDHALIVSPNRDPSLFTCFVLAALKEVTLWLY